ncbi:unnamed protein product [Polarella glacialis]|uniref:WW domain-containing protein n=1 Tax=Polarella glacialis TaxID=89957 RepID=A0A813HVJ6_POLGL|nr:unnamed protein product [Polarella glacialis]
MAKDVAEVVCTGSSCPISPTSAQAARPGPSTTRPTTTTNNKQTQQQQAGQLRPLPKHLRPSMGHLRSLSLPHMAATKQLAKAADGDGDADTSFDLEDKAPRRPRTTKARAGWLSFGFGTGVSQGTASPPEVGQVTPRCPETTITTTKINNNKTKQQQRQQQQQQLVKPMLLELYQRELTAEEASALLAFCPEVQWLADCAGMCPLPSGWHEGQRGESAPSFKCRGTGTVAKVPPQLNRFVRMAWCVVCARMWPDTAASMAARIGEVAETAHREVGSLRACWTGPHADAASGQEYFYCPSAGVSSWRNPCLEPTYVGLVAEKLLHASVFPNRENLLRAMAVKQEDGFCAAKAESLEACRPGAASLPLLEDEGEAAAGRLLALVASKQQVEYEGQVCQKQRGCEPLSHLSGQQKGADQHELRDDVPFQDVPPWRQKQQHMQQQQQQQTQQQQQQQLHEKHQLGQGADEQKDQFSSGPRHGQQQRLCKDVQELLDASYHQKNMQELQHGQEGQKQLVGLPFHGGQGQKEKHGSSTEPALSLESDNIKQPDDEHLPEQEHSGEARIALLRSAAERALPPEVAQRRPADQRCTAARLLSPEPLPNTTTTPTTTTARIKTTTPPTLRMRKRRTREAAAAQCMQSYLQAGEAAAAAAAAVPSQAVALQKLQKDNITAAIVEALEVRPWTPCLEDQDLQPSMRVHAPTSVPLFRARSAPAITREPSYISVRAAARPVRPTLPALPALPMPGPADTTALGEMFCPPTRLESARGEQGTRQGQAVLFADSWKKLEQLQQLQGSLAQAQLRAASATHGKITPSWTAKPNLRPLQIS